MKHYDKLVRDRIPEIIMREGGKPTFHRVSGEELKNYARVKVLEEAKEFEQSGQIEELVDLLETVFFYCRLEKMSWDEMNAKLHKKRAERGGFDGGVILDRVE
ncbi:nucleoside triphosphate pyrophosphohydrolase [Candidatus Acetothermia bacterium]|nr:nucleoside triphosphate pyrophosphohydrolase [Candidatus Acetothermia bacterium]MBI3659092.1 nucleoside triphosphate pyrophosphohydrolase [Candidatus Acetothermia bacterium]